MLQTYDRYFIEKWLNEGHKTCPQTQQVLSNCTLTPNILVQHMISQWCKDRGIQPPKPVGAVDGDNNTNAEEDQVTDEHIDHLHSLLLNLTLSVSDKKQAAKELRQLTKQMHSIRTLFNKSDLIEQLLRPLAGTANIDPELYEDLITTIHNLSLHDDNKKLLGENERVISILIDSLKFGTGATIQTRSNAAAAIFSLSALDSNKRIIGRAGAIRYLVDLLEEGNPLAIKDVASAIFNLCVADEENKEKTIREGTIQILLNKIRDQILVDELLSIVALLSSHSKAVEVLANHGAVPFLLGIIKDGMSDISKENCIAILYAIFRSDRRKWIEIFRSVELANHTLSKLEQYGTSRAKRKASSILRKLHPPSSSKPPAA